MNKLVFLSIALLFSPICSNILSGQSAKGTLTFKAIIADKNTQEPVAYATVFNPRAETGTISNLNGLAVLNSIRPQDTVVVSYIGYQSVVLIGTALPSIDTIFLETNSAELTEVVVTAENTFLYNLLSRCRKTKSKRLKTGKTYFELETFVDDSQVELLECYYNGSYSGYDVQSLDLKNGRIALSPFNNRYFVSTESSKALHMHGLFVANDYFPVNPLELNKSKLKKLYRLKLYSRYQDEQENTVFVIDYSPKNNPRHHFEGRIWIDSSSARILKITHNIEDAAIYPFLPLWSTDSLKQVDLHISKSFKTIDDWQYVHSIDFNYKLKYQNRDQFPYWISTNAVLYTYNFDQAFDLPFFEYAAHHNGDYRRINAAPYNAFFWDNMEEFRLNDRKNKKSLFLRDSASLNEQTLFLKNDYFDRGFFEKPYVPWSKNRINIKPSVDTTDYTDIQKDLLADRYQLSAQIYMDVNQIKDSIHCLTKTVFDPFNSYYKYDLTGRDIAFINMYFDLIEIQRRELDQAIREQAKTKAEAKRIYKEKMVQIEELSNNFFKEVNRGLNKRSTKKWNDYINQYLGIDNLEIIKSFLESDKS